MNEIWGHHTKWNKLDKMTNTVWSCLYVESIKTELIETENMCVSQGELVGYGGDTGQRVHTSSCKISTSWCCNVQHDEYS